MSLEDAYLDRADLALLRNHTPEAVISIGFRRAATLEQRHRFVQLISTNGGDVLSAIIDIAAEEKQVPEPGTYPADSTPGLQDKR